MAIQLQRNSIVALQNILLDRQTGCIDSSCIYSTDLMDAAKWRVCRSNGFMGRILS